MPNRTVKFVSAIFASFLAGTAVTTLSYGAARAGNEAQAADNCLAGPKGQTPAGGHWYYRIDHTTKRHCWYLGDEREKVARDARQEPAPPAKPVAANPVSPQKEATTQRTIADARAELPLPQAQIEPTSAATGQWPAAAAPNTPAANLANEEDSQRANARDTNTQSSLVASRWPESSGVSSSARAGPAIPNSLPAQVSVVAPPSSVIAAAPLAAADSSSESKAGSIQTLLIVIAGALALAGVMGAAVFRLGSLRQAKGREIRRDRRAIWDSIDTGRPPPAPFGRGELPVRRVDVPRKTREVDDASRRIAEMLAQLHEAGRTERSAISPAAAAKR